eukprot:8562408-Heterocapsa_arctica.AAC.1
MKVHRSAALAEEGQGIAPEQGPGRTTVDRVQEDQEGREARRRMTKKETRTGRGEDQGMGSRKEPRASRQGAPGRGLTPEE